MTATERIPPLAWLAAIPALLVLQGLILHAMGRVPMIAAKYDVLVAAADRLRTRLAQAGYALEGESEVAIEWYERGELGPIVCRCRSASLLLRSPPLGGAFQVCPDVV